MLLSLTSITIVGLYRKLYKAYILAEIRRNFLNFESACLAFKDNLPAYLFFILFVKFNKMLECKQKLNRKEGKVNVKHKPVIQNEDMGKLKSSPSLSFKVHERCRKAGVC